MDGRQRPLRILHFADAHIDMENYGRHDPESGLPIRVMDFLHALDQIVDTAIDKQVDLVLFAGDAYKDRNPQPTFQREWGQRMMRLSQAGIPTVLLVGNHDVAPAIGRAHTLHEFETLAVNNIHVADRLTLLGPDTLGLPLQVVTLPWVARSALVGRSDAAGKSMDEISLMVEERLTDAVAKLMDEADAGYPLVLLAHASVNGAQYGSERAVMLGHELVLSRSLVGDKRWSYVALGHIHKHQSLNDGGHPPIVYPGSIERIDFGEAGEKKGYVLAEVSRHETNWEFYELATRQFVDLIIDTDNAETFMEDVMRQLPPREQVRDAICRVRLSYPRDWEPLLDEAAIRDYFSDAMSISIQKHREIGNRSRLGDVAGLETLPPEELLALYWRTVGLDEDEAEAMKALAKDVLAQQTEDG